MDEFCFQSMMTYGAPARSPDLLFMPAPFELYNKDLASGELDLASEVRELKEADFVRRRWTTRPCSPL